MSNRVEVPIDTAKLVLERRNIGMVNPSIEIDDDANIVPRGIRSEYINNGAYTVMVRKATNSGDRPGNAKKLSACKGLKGCEFAECAREVFGKLPKNLEGLCSTDLKE
jgi:hypothetical protein